jgi:hypothetical protein
LTIDSEHVGFLFSVKLGVSAIPGAAKLDRRGKAADYCPRNKKRELDGDP